MEDGPLDFRGICHYGFSARKPLEVLGTRDNEKGGNDDVSGSLRYVKIKFEKPIPTHGEHLHFKK